ncbi:SpoIIE family protein phosphatase [Paludisphaera soli]|uniref:SpoIIE family protein phosphatase n=1 Tax=Paludisphaera soli TaxID=2712865 RepID=UPI0013EC66D0|nr:SpoIIE family protein phosphatase [Paludisphaera soli]
MPQHPNFSRPRLVVLSGPTAGRCFELAEDIVLIGRSPDSDLILGPKSVSRRHARIVREGGEFRIHDLESTRGTYVDGRRVTRPATLRDEAVIQIGEVALRFLLRPIPVQIVGDERSTIAAAVDLLRPEEQGHSIARPEEKLRALRKMGRDFGGELVVDTLLGRVLESLFEIFPQASSGAVLLEDSAGGLVPGAVRSRAGRAESVIVSKTILDRVIRSGQAILSRDAHRELADVESVAGRRVRSLMCVPIVDLDHRPMGVVQIEADDRRELFTEEDLDLLASVAGQISVAIQNAQMHLDLIQQRELERDLVAARHVMQALLPERPGDVAGYAFWDCYEPARHVGGDYLGFIPMCECEAPAGSTPRRWAIAVGDVVGKGLGAALLTARLSAEVSLFLQDARDPAEVLTRLNRRLSENDLLDMYVTFLLVILDVEAHTLRVVNAGHPAPLIRRRGGRVEELGCEVSGLPLAIDRSTFYESAETRLEPGEFVIMYTDGVSDAMNCGNERYGEARLRELLAHPRAFPREAGEAVLEDVRRHAAGRAQFDDLTLVVFGRP